MALICAGSKCAICDEALGKEPLFVTSGVWLQKDDPLWRFCDAPMHWRCYADWPERERFAESQVQASMAGAERNPYWSTVHADEHAHVTVNPHPPVEEVSVHLRATGSSVRIPLSSWADWVSGYATEGELHVVERAALRDALPALRAALPDREALLRSYDWRGKSQLVAERAVAHERTLGESAAQTARWNAACVALDERLRANDCACPHCHHESTEARFVDRRPDGKSLFVCEHCKRSFGPDDMSAR